MSIALHSLAPFGFEQNNGVSDGLNCGQYLISKHLEIPSVLTEYDGLGKITKLTVDLTTDQVTRYLYTDTVHADLNTHAIYPDSSETTSGGNKGVRETKVSGVIDL